MASMLAVAHVLFFIGLWSLIHFIDREGWAYMQANYIPMYIVGGLVKIQGGVIFRILRYDC